jgi:hypothetical protein
MSVQAGRKVVVCLCDECNAKIETLYVNGKIVGHRPIRKGGKTLCDDCSFEPTFWPSNGNRAGHLPDEDNPWQQVRIRAMEDSQ